MGILAEWRAARDRRRRAARYLLSLLAAPPAAEVDWLADAIGNRPVAERELGFARRAVGLIVAERDALDDRTASDVAHRLAEFIAKEARVTPEAGRLWVERWRGYTATLAVRGDGEAVAARLARVLLQGAGIAEPPTELLVKATQYVLTTRGRANEALRSAFGVATLPEDVRPSALRAP